MPSAPEYASSIRPFCPSISGSVNEWGAIGSCTHAPLGSHTALLSRGHSGPCGVLRVLSPPSPSISGAQKRAERPRLGLEESDLRLHAVSICQSSSDRTPRASAAQVQALVGFCHVDQPFFSFAAVVGDVIQIRQEFQARTTENSALTEIQGPIGQSMRGSGKEATRRRDAGCVWERQAHL